MYNLNTAFPKSHQRNQSLHSVLCPPEFTTLNLCIRDLTVLESCFSQLYWSGFFSEIVVNSCVCGGFEVVADGLKYPSEDRRLEEQVLFDSLLVLRKWRECSSAGAGEHSSIQGAIRKKDMKRKNHYTYELIRIFVTITLYNTLLSHLYLTD